MYKVRGYLNCSHMLLIHSNYSARTRCLVFFSFYTNTTHIHHSNNKNNNDLKNAFRMKKKAGTEVFLLLFSGAIYTILYDDDHKQFFVDIRLFM